MQSLQEIEFALNSLISHYAKRNNRIKAFAAETGLSNIFICRYFKISPAKLYVLLNNPIEYSRPGRPKGSLNKRERRDSPFNLDNHRFISQDLIRLR